MKIQNAFANIKHKNNIRHINSNDINLSLQECDIYSLITHLITQKNKETRSKIVKRTEKLLKRYIDNYIINLLDNKDYYGMVVFLTYCRSILKLDIKYSTLNIILKHIVSRLECNNIIKFELYSPYFNEVGINILDSLFVIICSNFKNSIKCNHNYFKLSVSLIFYLFKLCGSKYSKQCVDLLFMSMKILDNENIYLDELTVSRLIYIYSFVKLSGDINVKYKKLKVLYDVISNHILSYEDATILNSVCSYKSFNYKSINICNNKNVITRNVYCSIKEMRHMFFSNICKNNKKNYGKHWTQKMYNIITFFNLLDSSNDSSDIFMNKDINIIDGRNKYYNAKIAKNNNIDLGRLNNDLRKFEYNTTYIIFNIKHYDIIITNLKSYLYSLMNSRKLKIIKGGNSNKNIVITKINSNKNNTMYLDEEDDYKSFVFIFTPRNVDDDLMSIYLKLTFPYSNIYTNDKYGKYLEYFKSSNHYYYTLWSKIFDF